MHAGAGAAGRLEAQAELNALDGRDGEQRAADARGEPVARRGVASHARNKARRHDAKRPAQALPRLFGPVDGRLHGLGGRLVRAAHLARLDGERLVVGRAHERIVLFEARVADGGHVREHLHAKVGEELAGDAGGRHARRRLAGARTLQNVAAVVGVGLERAHEVGVAGTRRDLALEVARRPAERRHALLPVLPVAVAHDKRHRRAGRAPEAHAGHDLHDIMLDLLPTAAAISGLPPRKVGVDLGLRYFKARRHALHDGCEAGAVAFARCEVSHSFVAFRAFG